jgi:molecular chaperone GrpE
MNQTDVENAKTVDQERAGQASEAEPVVAIDLDNLTSEQLEELKQRAAKADEHWDRLIRTTADFDNFRKRAVREKQEAIRYANESLLEKLLPVLDSFEKALSASQDPGAAAQSLQTGVQMVAQQLRTILTEAGLEEIDALGKQFDPNLHEAISQQPAEGVAEGHVLQQLRKGYRLRERLLRPASVIVAGKPS